MTARERISEAALSLFEERGFDQTTIEDVVERAGVGRTTFFRHFRSKEEAVLPHQAALLDQVTERLNRPEPEPLDVRVTEAARIVLDHYLTEGELARSRYRLVSAVPAVRAREYAGQRAYQRAFRAAIHAGLSDVPDRDLEAELVGQAVVTAHNHVLRCWLRGESTDPVRDFDRALRRATEPLRRTGTDGAPDTLAVDAARSALPALERLLPAVRRLADADPSES
ncbi:TetR family transcriptional regulator [Nocardioides sp. 616]|uniref:TetR family transcriptional regulator n=1 Tax=Nocardioides sp. 616 TaxID=2268090 RepID=UPI0013B3B2C9|nr:TetR family transcriptional regulator [Nocardioides sp. 616]